MELRAVLRFAISAYMALHLPSAHGQFVVNDAAMLESLTEQVPAALSGNVLDTLHPDVLSTTYLVLWSDQGNILQSAEGIQFFDSLETLYIPYMAGTQLPPLPAGLKNLGIDHGLLTSLPMLPQGLVQLICKQNDLTTLPDLPSTLKELTCDNNTDLSALPALPQALEILRCAYAQLTELPSLPPSLFLLECHGNALTSLPSLPPDLVYLRCEYNSLSTLPTLPPGLATIYCHHNPITTLPELPVGLNFLSCGNTSLTALPALNDSLRILSCFDNALTVLPALPAGLTFLNCYNNQFTTLPDLPDSLETLVCYDNQLGCLPWLPNSLGTIQCYNNPLGCLPNIPTSFNLNSILGFPLNICNLNTAPCPINDEAVSGSVFIDANSNGSKDPGEAPFRYTYVRATPGSFITAPDSAGRFAMPLDVGSYSVDGDAMPYHTRTNPPYNVSLAALETDTGLHIGYWPAPGVHDLRVDLAAFPAVRGQDNNVWIQVQNPGTEPEEAVVDLAFAVAQTWVSSSQPPDAVDVESAQWSVHMLPGAIWNCTVTMHTPPSTLAETPVPYALSAFGAEQDTTPNNNSVEFYQEVLTSCDPNDKHVSPASILPGEDLPTAGLDYMIRFQNTGTAHAFRVVITDTLPPSLDAGSISSISSSHVQHWFVQNNVLHFVFDPIDLPDSTTDQANSQGFVKFSIRPFPGLQPGNVVLNQANIYFDFNDPVITAPSTFSIAFPEGLPSATQPALMQVRPNPATDHVQILHPAGIDRVDVITTDGRLLHRFAGRERQLQLDLGDLPRGCVLVRVITGTNVYVERLLLR
ncbi:MAG: DUF11 domain-containing protein [Flavobacteriales bacterium]|nr:DUF11 domain-containing protein [Flavobacteriales bacterium]